MGTPVTGFALAMLVALGVDALLGWPDRVYRWIGHPVTWIGRLIAALDARLNRDGIPGGRRLAGALCVALCLGVTMLAATAIAQLLPGGWTGAVLTGLLAWPLVAARSLHDHVAAVARPLEAGDLEAARRAVSMIVGRDTTGMDAQAVARSALESLAENTSDGIVAPLFWGLMLGLPGIAAYKTINTLDSMIGHRTPRHEAFGMIAARLDDLVNFVPARLTALLFALVSGRPAHALRCVTRDAGKHRSPNAGWPEAALAVALGLRLSGPRSYAGRMTEDPFVNPGGRDPGAAEIRLGLGVMRRSLVGITLFLVLIAAI